MRIDFSLSPGVVSRLRIASIEKYGNLRSMSKLVEELVIKSLDGDDTGGKVEPMSPIILRHFITKTLMAIDEGKPVAMQEAFKSPMPGKTTPNNADIEKLTGIKAEYKRLMADVPCFTPNHKAALRAKYEEITNGLCEGTLDRAGWCPNCESYYRVPSLNDKYVHIDKIKEHGYEYVTDHDDAPSCDINYGKLTGQAK